ncbi:MAG: two-component system response regulator [Verrucomicrobiales bacterium]|nr:two-component system response regulator [Verrucomicrobiales bacterium]
MTSEPLVEVNTASVQNSLQHLLIVEPDPEQAGILLNLLRRAGVDNPSCRVATFLEAMNYLKGEGSFGSRNLYPLPSVIFLNLEPSGYLGFKLMEWIHTQPETSECVLVICSELSGVLDLSKCYRLGAKTFLLKPFNLAEVKNMVQHFPAFWKSTPEKRRA